MSDCRRTVRYAATVAFVCSLAQLASGIVVAQELLFSFEPIESLLDPEMRVATTAEPIRIEQAPQTVFAAGNAPASPDASLGDPIAQLRLDANWLLAVPEDPPPLFEFGMADTPIRMVVAEKIWDYDLAIMHFTLIDPESDDYARISVAWEEQEMVGTVFLGDAEFRILPVAEDTQWVFPVRYRGEYRRVTPPDIDTRMGMLEARHLQMAWYAKHQPRRFDTRTDGRLHGYGADRESIEAGVSPLGHIDIWSAMRFGDDGEPEADVDVLASKIAQFLNGVGHITMIHDPIEVFVERADLNSIYGGQENMGMVYFRQQFGGMPLDSRVMLTVNSSGAVFTLSGALMRKNTVSVSSTSPITEELAIAAAIRSAVENHQVLWSLEFRSAERVTAIAEDVAGARQVWRVDLSPSGLSCNLSYRVDIDIATGEVVKSVESVNLLGFGVPSRDELYDACLTAAESL